MGAPGGARGGYWVGFDLVEVERLRRALERHPRLEQRLYTSAEAAYCRERGKPVLHLAARLAAKEAVGKLLGTGVLSWQEIEIVAAGSDRPGSEGVRSLRPCWGGAPRVVLRGSTALAAEQRGIAEVRVSLSHIGALAGACALVVAKGS